MNSNIVDNLFRFNHEVNMYKQMIEVNCTFKNFEGVYSRIARGSFREGIDIPEDYAEFDDRGQTDGSQGVSGQYNSYEMIRIEDRVDAELLGEFLGMHYMDLMGSQN